MSDRDHRGFVPSWRHLLLNSGNTPREYDLIFSVFKARAQAEWFDRTDENEDACARFVLMQFDSGGLDANQLYRRCIQAA